MHELSVLAAANEAPKRDCVIADERVWSYADLAKRVRAALGLLRAQGVEPGDRVALTPDVDVDSIAWLYALFELGCPAVLLHPRLTDRECAVVLGEAQPRYRIAEPMPDDASGEETLAFPPVSAERTLAIVYTSGSRGRPRGARLSHRAFIASEAAHAANLGWLPEDRWLLSMPPAHVGGLSILTRSLIARSCVVLSPGTFDPEEVTRVMARHRVTLCSVVPTMLRRMLALEQPAWTPSGELRAVLVGGAPFSDSLRELAAKRNVPTLATYGCTEACSQITTQTAEQSGRPGSGVPLPGIELQIQEGEIQVRGSVLMDGYLGQDRSGDPWTSDGWLRTGDFGSLLADGQLLVRGRIDDLIVTGGENVAPQEVEVWLESVSGISSACVFSVPNDEWGQEVVAAIAVDSTRYSADTLRDRLAEELATYKHPKRICVVDALPINRSGKVDRAAVELQFAGQLRPLLHL
ncbi:MAG: acyl--CoA ligase [Deltaproteobacteria bacterium]|nr:acyl--CoA ligase [Deltaproteobacteria bacterium]MBW2211560.1 acyl--CoA ligase [Deltaproteobacteria bacterium]MBW2213240.1 acyl--CoA ligase [Deltaproteobacteria bacterium]MBW2551532.1 acyl--CoA ligase [Deltaproteobacteria bacterium]MBW2685797.1 acyl--CoA ligase [Deltaproteobacteria bacterium]